MPQPVVAEVTRSGFVEGHHYGAVVALAPDGSVDWAVGETTEPILPRSCNKPLQGLGMVRLGLRLPPPLLALACASHSGEDFHRDGVRRILAGAGLDESALRTPPDYPLDDEERDRLIREGGRREPIHMNCSGKHAAMLATCVLRGWDTEGYLHPEHPLQRGLAEVFVEMTAAAVAGTPVDGCGAPIFPTPLTGLARGFGLLVRGLAGDGRPDPAAREVADAMRAHPEYVSGTRRDERMLLAAVPGAIGKAGAESCYVVALADGRAVALKVDDGAARVRPALMAGALVRLGVDQEPGVHGEDLRRTGVVPVLGGGEQVGQVRPVWPEVAG